MSDQDARGRPETAESREADPVANDGDPGVQEPPTALNAELAVIGSAVERIWTAAFRAGRAELQAEDAKAAVTEWARKLVADGASPQLVTGIIVDYVADALRDTKGDQ